MTRSWFASGAVALVLAFTAVLAAAQETDQYFGQRVTEVRFVVEGQTGPGPNLSNLVDVRVGLPLTREQVRESQEHLSARYDSVRVDVDSKPDGVVIIFHLVPRYPINRVAIVGSDTGVSSGQLESELRQRFIGVATDLRLENVEDLTRRILNDAGYLNSEVSVRTEVETNSSRATLIVTVSAGPLALIAHSEVRGATLISAADVLRRTGTEPGRPFRRREIDTRLSEIEDDLRAQSHYEAQVSLSDTPASSGVDVVIVIDAGPRVELHVEPSTSLLPGRVDDLIPVSRLRSADQDLLEDARARIEAGLRREGYATASAPFTRDPSLDGSVLGITFTINRGPKFFVDRIDLDRLPPAIIAPVAVRKVIAVQPGAAFDEEKFIVGLTSLVDAYNRLGYYLAKAEPTRELVAGRSTPTESWVVLDPNLTLGPRGVVTEVRFDFQGEHRVPDPDLRARLLSRAGEPYLALNAVLDQDALTGFYRERGYLNATVARNPQISADGTSIVLAFTISEGAQILIDRVTVTGNERLSEQQILEVLALTPGQPLSAPALLAARQRLMDTGGFRNATVTAEARLSGETAAHVVVNVTEIAPVSGGVGGGLEGGSFPRPAEDGGSFEDSVDIRPRGFFEISRRNIGGRNRTLSFFARVSIRSRDDVETLGVPETGFAFAEHRVTTTYREQRAFKSNTDLLLALTSEQAVSTSYTSLRQGFNAEFLRRPTPRVLVSGRYGLDFTRLSNVRVNENERPLIDRLFPQVRLSLVASGISWDSRDNILSPTRGVFLSADAEVAARAIGSEVGYLKTFFSASRFSPIGPASPIILGLRAQVGLAHGFQRTVETEIDGFNRTVVVEDLPVSQRFFAGGSTTVRGFQQDRLGFFDPAPCPPFQVCSVIDPETGLSVGGNSVVILNAELRRSIAKLFGKNFAVASFIDAGNVFLTASDLNLRQIRGSFGGGVRWDSPLGPLRFDVGFKMNRLFIAGDYESEWEYHLSIGEALR